MDFDQCKENVQPLRSGRNAAQLEVALQAPHNPECQQELLQQRQEFENAIRNYVGPDPLHLHYQYIYWVEQSYPSNEGNLLPLLESCLSKFENDKRYSNDPRYCKLWIKFIDMQKNPIELYQMLHSRGIGIACADLYKAWAFYHEAVGDFRNADIVFQTGIKNLAQPYNELIQARENMVFAAGQQLINGLDENRLAEQRLALTTLHTCRPGRVGAARVASSSTHGVVPVQNEKQSSRSNVPVQVYSENPSEPVMGASAPPTSVLSAVKRDAVKENLMKAGPWNGGLRKKAATSNCQRQLPFTVHDDTDATPENIGIRLPVNFSPHSHEDFSRWKSEICLPDPDDPTKIPMYPKKQVYVDPTTEYSMEEIRARIYIRKMESQLSVPLMETEQAIQSIIEIDENDHVMHDIQEVAGYQPALQVLPDVQLLQTKMSPNAIPTVNPSHLGIDFTVSGILSPDEVVGGNNSFWGIKQLNLTHQPTPPPQSVKIVAIESPLQTPQPKKANFLLQEVTLRPSPRAHCSFTDETLGLWGDDGDDPILLPKMAVEQFSLLEESPMTSNAREARRVQPKGSAMKTPFKEINDEDLAETGSRGGMDTAAVAQPTDGATDYGSTTFAPLTPNTELFKLDAVHVSTPHNSQQCHAPELKSSKKQLFTDNKLSIIVEERSAASSSSSSSSQKSTMNPIFKSSTLNPIDEGSIYRLNLAQNMKANAALREQLRNSLGSMDCEPQTNVCIDNLNEEEEIEEPEQLFYMPTEHVPYPVLPDSPSDPFKPLVIDKLLRHVEFPGRHRYGYIITNEIPKLQVRKEPLTIGPDKYLIEKLLGKGTFGQVYRALRLHANEPVALKVQKPPNKWEFYICREIQNRLADSEIKDKYMNVHMGYFSETTSVLLSEFSPNGSLLDAANLIRTKTNRCLKESICIYFTIEMLNILEAMHRIKIIHADIKPDNFLIMLNKNNMPTLQLIDFGCSIDMSLYPEGTTFTRRITTEHFICCEMHDGRPWSYHTDYFCVAATTHVLLFEKYIDLKKVNNAWMISHKLPRYYNTEIWNTFFHTLLNMQEGLPSIDGLRQYLEGHKVGSPSNDIREFVNIIKNR